jgi:hypothetical protein
MPDAMSFEKTQEPDYNPKDEIVFQKNPLIGLVIARLPKSVLSLYWCGGLGGETGQVYFGRPLLPTNKGGHITRVRNYDFEYAATEKEFRELAKRFDEGAKEN